VAMKYRWICNFFYFERKSIFNNLSAIKRYFTSYQDGRVHYFAVSIYRSLSLYFYL